MEKEEIEELIDSKFRDFVSLEGKREEKLSKVIEKFELKVHILKQEIPRMIFEETSKQEYLIRLEKSVKRFIVQEVNTRIKNDKLHKIVGDLVSNKIDDLMRDQLQGVIKEVLNRMNHTINNELKIAKEISYSIDKEIQDISRQTCMSYKDHQNIKERIERVLGNSKPNKNKLWLEQNTTTEINKKWE